jgi:hypothetical protein
MPYDNNLSGYKDTIISQIRKGITNDKITVTIQSDEAGNGIERRIISYKGISSFEKVDSDLSASTAVFGDYLKWAGDNVKAEKTVLVFLDHGGKLDELCQDEFPVSGYLKVDSVARVIEEENRNNNRKLDLLFLQVCAKGSIEPLYEFRNCSRYTLYSQTNLGAPNYYYTRFFETLSKNPEIELPQLSKLIADYERSDMYYSYSCIDNNTFKKFVVDFGNLISEFSKQPENRIRHESVQRYYYENETYYDLKSFLSNLDASDPTLKKAKQLSEYFTDKVLVFNKINPQYDKMKQACGMNILAPLKLEYYKKYENLEWFRVVNPGLLIKGKS